MVKGKLENFCLVIFHILTYPIWSCPSGEFYQLVTSHLLNLFSLERTPYHLFIQPFLTGRNELVLTAANNSWLTQRTENLVEGWAPGS